MADNNLEVESIYSIIFLSFLLKKKKRENFLKFDENAATIFISLDIINVFTNVKKQNIYSFFCVCGSILGIVNTGNSVVNEYDSRKLRTSINH